jgi:hypothetical protein
MDHFLDVVVLSGEQKMPLKGHIFIGLPDESYAAHAYLVNYIKYTL